MSILLEFRLRVEEVGEESRSRIQLCDGNKISRTREMTWCNNPDDDRALLLVTAAATKEPAVAATTAVSDSKTQEIRIIICPSCGHNIPYQDQVHILIIINLLYSFIFVGLFHIV